MTDPVISVRGLVAGYAGVAVVRGLDLTVGAGEVVALLGPNGAGKTTTLMTIAGAVPAIAGEIDVLGEPAVGRPSHVLARRGLSLLPQDRGLFPQLTVGDNLRLRHRRGSKVAIASVLELFPALRGLLTRRAGLLSGGEQQMLALAGQIVSGPRVVLIDELSMGLAPVVVDAILPIVRRITDELGIGVLLVEQHVAAALEIADRAVVLVRGRVVLDGDAGQLGDDRSLLESAYLS
ncbi:ABC transporter ATP-binding protein [Desertimonas flava]|uniref:ABC transporter ATP-binding protein n=1 Tax=Desertimonas flava TaxID=2064846 RepID=UPI000E342292|nr:ATP-binding cassette domain-containing protein [Desertimonas flava]